MKKKIIWITSIALLILLFVIAKPIRTKKVMEDIAIEILNDEPFCLFTDKNQILYKDVKGPLITDRQERVQFTWYKVLDWGDTATISAYVYKNFITEILGAFRIKNPPSMTADLKWYYVYVPGGISEFSDVLQNKVDSQQIDKLEVKLKKIENNFNSDSFIFLVEPERLLFFLKKGHFQVVEKQKEFTLVNFYQPIAKISNKSTKKSISTLYAKVFFNDSLELIILPYEILISQN